jgi:hypothetical protein
MSDQPIVSVFGGSAPPPGSPAYEEAEAVGRLLAEAGFVVMTGGYAGTMEATSKGAKDAGGHVIGVASGIIESRFGAKMNTYIDEAIYFDSLSERLHHLVVSCAAAIGLPGGIGTLSEVSLMWSLMQVGEIKPMPLVLLGQNWGDTLTTFYGDGAYIRPDTMALWRLAHTPADAVRLIQNWNS